MDPDLGICMLVRMLHTRTAGCDKNSFGFLLGKDLECFWREELHINSNCMAMLKRAFDPMIMQQTCAHRQH